MENHIINLFDEYIEKCDDVLSLQDIIKAEELELEIVNTFESYNKSIDNNLTQNLPTLDGGYYELANYLYNIKILRSRLNGYKAIELTKKANNEIREDRGINITNVNQNTNNNDNKTNIDINIDLLVEKAIKNIENNESLPEDDIKEVIEKIKEIQGISKSEESKNKKWFKLRPIMTWIGSSGLSVATEILGLITAILNLN